MDGSGVAVVERGRWSAVVGECGDVGWLKAMLGVTDSAFYPLSLLAARERPSSRSRSE